MSSLALGNPYALAALAILVPLAMAWGHAEVRHRRISRVYDGSLGAERNVHSPIRRLRAAALVTAVVLAAFAMARPQWGTAKSPVERRGIDIVVALDISRSMQAADVSPSRAVAAANGLRQMLAHLGGDRVGLVTFGGNAIARSPLTLDVDAIADLVARAQKEGALVQPGTDIGAAINTALQALDVPDKARTQSVVLISDGEDLGNAATDAVENARKQGVRIYTVAAGTEQGALVPAGERAQPGAPEVVSKADRAGLARIAADTGGTSRDVTALAGLAVDFARLRQSSFDQDQQQIPIERFQWVLGPAALLLLLYTMLPTNRRAIRAKLPVARSPLAASALLSTLLIACGGTAAFRSVEAGNKAFASGRFEQALAAYNAAKQLTPNDSIVSYNLGNTLHRLERFEEAASASKSAATTTKDGLVYARATYALGADAFRRGSLPEARDAFVAVLQRDPNDDAARHNLEVVLRALRPQAPPPPGQDGQPNPGQQPGQQPQPTATIAPGQGGQPGGLPDPNNNGASQGGQPGAGGGATGGQETEAEARARLQRALEGLTGDVTPEQALAILDAARRASEQGTLGRPGAPSPNDR